MRYRIGISTLGAVAVAGLAACSPPPDLEARVSPAAREAPFPELVATQPILDRVAPLDETNAQREALEARAAAAQARGEALSGPVIDAPTREALRDASARHDGTEVTPQ